MVWCYSTKSKKRPYNFKKIKVITDNYLLKYKQLKLKYDFSSSIPIKCKIQCPQTSCCIRITNLSRKVSKHFLHQIFSEFGTIKKLDLHFNTYDRISKGFSYIMFSTPEESENAVITMDRCEFTFSILIILIYVTGYKWW